MDQELKQYLQDMEQRVYDRIEKTETNLLKAFHKWARPMELRVNGMTTLVTGFDERLALIESRLFDLETKE